MLEDVGKHLLDDAQHVQTLGHTEMAGARQRRDVPGQFDTARRQDWLEPVAQGTEQLSHVGRFRGNRVERVAQLLQRLVDQCRQRCALAWRRMRAGEQRCSRDQVRTQAIVQFAGDAQSLVGLDFGVALLAQQREVLLQLLVLAGHLGAQTVGSVLLTTVEQPQPLGQQQPERADDRRHRHLGQSSGYLGHPDPGPQQIDQVAGQQEQHRQQQDVARQAAVAPGVSRQRQQHAQHQQYRKNTHTDPPGPVKRQRQHKQQQRRRAGNSPDTTLYPRQVQAQVAQTKHGQRQHETKAQQHLADQEALGRHPQIELTHGQESRHVQHQVLQRPDPGQRSQPQRHRVAQAPTDHQREQSDGEQRTPQGRWLFAVSRRQGLAAGPQHTVVAQPQR